MFFSHQVGLWLLLAGILVLWISIVTVVGLVRQLEYQVMQRMMPMDQCRLLLGFARTLVPIKLALSVSLGYVALLLLQG